MNKYTQGPWVIQPKDVQKDVASPDLIVGPLYGEQVCCVYIDNERDRANAHLISAVPDLFEACKRVLAEIEGGDEISIGAEEDLIAAIEKAEGQHD